MTDEDFVACLSTSHPLATARIVKASAFKDDQFVMFARDISPGYYDTVISICARDGFSPNISFEVGHWLTAILLVAKGLGVTLVPRCFVGIGLHGVSFVELKLLARIPLRTSLGKKVRRTRFSFALSTA